MRRLLMVVAVVFAVGAAGTALAQSKCDAGVAKATGKKAGCECGAVAKAIKKGGSPDFSKCTTKFSAACSKATGVGDCVVQTKPCSTKESEVDTFVADHCTGSPSGAFLE